MSLPTEDTLQTLRLVISAMQCLERLERVTLSDAERIGICLDIVGDLRAVLDTCLTATCARLALARDIPDEAWTALTDLAALVSNLPEAETPWIDTAVWWLQDTERRPGEGRWRLPPAPGPGQAPKPEDETRG